MPIDDLIKINISQNFWHIGLLVFFLVTLLILLLNHSLKIRIEFKNKELKIKFSIFGFKVVYPFVKKIHN